MKRKACLRLDRVFPGVGRINIVSGATTAAEHRRRDALLTELYDRGQLEILRAIRSHQLSVAEVYSAQRAGRLGFTLASVALRRSLWEAVGLDAESKETGSGWLPSSGRAPAASSPPCIGAAPLARCRSR